MPLSNARSDATDGNTAQWDKVKAMRDAQAAKERGESSGTPMTVIGIETPAKTPPVETPPAKLEQPRGEDGKFVKAPEGAPASAAEPPIEAPKKAAPAPAPPAAKDILIDGVTVQVAPELADVFERAEKINKENAAVSEKEQLKEQIRAELRAEMVPPAKPDAELAAERALAEAERLKSAPKKPESKLLIENPDEYEKQRDAYEEWRTSEAIRKANDARDAKDRASAQVSRAQLETQARETLRVQFYQTYPTLKDSTDLVDIVIGAHFDDAVKSGKLNNAATLPAEQKEQLKQQLFAGIATAATKRLVKLMQGGKAVVPPPPPPPQFASSQNQRPAGQREVLPPKEEAKPKYPKGSISAVLAERKARMSGASA